MTTETTQHNNNTCKSGIFCLTSIWGGGKAQLLKVEAEIVAGFSGSRLIGQASESCKEGKERAKAALEAMGIVLGPQSILINISPGDQKKEGNHFDLPIAICLGLVSKNFDKIKSNFNFNDWIFAAELSLRGELRPTRGVISMALESIAQGKKGIVISKENESEVLALKRIVGNHSENFNAMAFSNLEDVFLWIQGKSSLLPLRSALKLSPTSSPLPTKIPEPNFDDMHLSQEQEKLAVTIAYGGHFALLHGFPGMGKSMFASRIRSILPPMSNAKHIEVLKVYSSSSNRFYRGIDQGVPPYRAPHHQTNPVAILGSSDMPGELSLAHGGVLFLDELTEFRRDIIESLREPLETGEVRVSRARLKVKWPARPLFIAACNPCPCGYYGSETVICRCGISQLLRYQAKLSGPVLDRMDIIFCMTQQIECNKNHLSELLISKKENRTLKLKKQVQLLTDMFKNRNQALISLQNHSTPLEPADFAPNSIIPAESLLKATGLSETKITAIIEKFEPEIKSKRSLLKVLRLSRTIADIENDEILRESHIEQALKWRDFKKIQISI